MKDTNNKQRNITTITINLNNNSLSVISICLYMYVFCHKNDELFICLIYVNKPLTYLLTYNTISSHTHDQKSKPRQITYYTLSTRVDAPDTC